MSETEEGPAGEEVDEHPQPSAAGEVIFETTPTIKPTLIVMSITLLVGVGIELWLLQNPDAVGGQEIADIVMNVVAVFLLLAILRFIVRMVILERTTYQITTNAIKREYQLLFRELSREVPLEELRAHELRKSRIQSLLGFGTVRFLTGGTNESLGFIEFEHVVDSAELRETVRDVLL